LVIDKIVAKDLTEDAIAGGETAIMAELPESVQQLTELSGEGDTTNLGVADDSLRPSDADARPSDLAGTSELLVTKDGGEDGTMHASADGEIDTRPSKATDVGAAATALLSETGLYGDTAPSDATDPPSAPTMHADAENGGSALQSDEDWAKLGTQTERVEDRPLEGSPADVQAATQLILDSSGLADAENGGSALQSEEDWAQIGTLTERVEDRPLVEDASEVPITEASAVGGTTNTGADSV
jgi:hypothetical protein